VGDFPKNILKKMKLRRKKNVSLSTLSMSRVRIVTIEGNIGAGKSTLLTTLREHVEHVVFVPEPVDEWDTIRDKDGMTMLQKFYKDPTTYAFPFQMMAFISRMVLLRDAVKHAKDRSIAEKAEFLVVSERSMLTDKNVFAAMMRDMGHLEDMDFAIYNKWFGAFATEFDVNDVIYLDVTPKTCVARVAKRARPGEDPISLDYLTRCGNYHAKFIRGLIERNKRILTLDENTSPSEWTHNVLQFLCPPTGTLSPVSPPALRRNSRSEALLSIYRANSNRTHTPVNTTVDLHTDATHTVASQSYADIEMDLTFEWNSYAISSMHPTQMYIREPATGGIPFLSIHPCTYDDRHRGAAVVVRVTNTGNDPITIPVGTHIAQVVMG
jgi:deoxyadenosine/deoxycytidine kinase